MLGNIIANDIRLPEVIQEMEILNLDSIFILDEDPNEYANASELVQNKLYVAGVGKLGLTNATGNTGQYDASATKFDQR
jgi:hypothetical protein